MRTDATNGAGAPTPTPTNLARQRYESRDQFGNEALYVGLMQLGGDYQPAVMIRSEGCFHLSYQATYTPEQARELAAEIIAAAERAEALAVTPADDAHLWPLADKEAQS